MIYFVQYHHREMSFCKACYAPEGSCTKGLVIFTGGVGQFFV